MTTFPKLMISKFTHRLVLFNAPGCGTVIDGKGAQGYHIDGRFSDGEYSTGWEMETFQDYDGEITLSNKEE